MRRRTRARELALQFLYMLEVRGIAARDELDSFLTDAGASRPARQFATELVDGVILHRTEIDQTISTTAANWSLHRMPAVDLSILRIGGFELLYSPDVPIRVALNEAIELGKRYSTAQSGSFINGILDRLKGHRRLPAEVADAPDDHDAEEELSPSAHDDEASATR